MCASPSHTSVGSFALSVGPRGRVFAPIAGPHTPLFASPRGPVRKPLHLGVDFISYQENIDTTTPQGEMIFTVMASLAQFESALISARVKAGMARARAQGKRISRTPLPTAVQERIAALYQQGLSIHQIGKQLGIGYGTAWNYVQRVKAGTRSPSASLEA
jgi:DNA invertase Pin-like site-specific DNA recombinase